MFRKSRAAKGLAWGLVSSSSLITAIVAGVGATAVGAWWIGTHVSVLWAVLFVLVGWTIPATVGYWAGLVLGMLLAIPVAAFFGSPLKDEGPHQDSLSVGSPSWFARQQEIESVEKEYGFNSPEAHLIRRALTDEGNDRKRETYPPGIMSASHWWPTEEQEELIGRKQTELKEKLGRTPSVQEITDSFTPEELEIMHKPKLKGEYIISEDQHEPN